MPTHTGSSSCHWCTSARATTRDRPTRCQMGKSRAKLAQLCTSSPTAVSHTPSFLFSHVLLLSERFCAPLSIPLCPARLPACETGCTRTAPRYRLRSFCRFFLSDLLADGSPSPCGAARLACPLFSILLDASCTPLAAFPRPAEATFLLMSGLSRAARVGCVRALDKRLRR